MDVWVGTAGYAYPAWVGGFYPPKTSSERMLPFYATRFAAVEINSSFHRPPTVEQVRKMARKVPAGFQFTLKVPQSASHEFKPDDLPAFRLAAEALAERGQLLGLLVQVAESFHNTPGHREWLTTIREQLQPFPLAVEFRHVSWDVPGLPGWVEANGFDLVSVGVPAIPTLFPTGPRVVGRRFYARLHSQNAAAWYAGGPARYDFDYPEAVIGKWADAVAAAAERGVERATVFFNNCVGVQAVQNATRFADLLRERHPRVNVIRPPEPDERSLFDEVG
ncbi:MAG: DUF72 domain-containing protein [Gemmataceae bacterium]